MEKEIILILNREAELLALNNIANEIAHGIRDKYLDEKIIQSRPIFETILNKARSGFGQDKTVLEISLTLNELSMIVYATPFVLKYLGIEDTHARLGVTLQEAQAFLLKLESILQKNQT